MEVPELVRLQDPVAKMGEETRRQHAVVEATGLRARDGPQIGTGPKKVVGLRHDDPGWEIVEAKMGLQGCRNRHRVERIARWAVRYRYHRDDFVAPDQLTRDDEGAWPCLAAFFRPGLVLPRPEIRIRNYKPGLRGRQADGVQSSMILSSAA